MKKQIFVVIILALINTGILIYSLIPDKEIIDKKQEEIENKEEIFENETLTKFKKQKYFLEKNKDTYLEYYEENKDKEIDEIIKIVNTNINHEFFTNTKEANISKDFLILVNKYYYLKEDYEPNNLVTINTNYATSNQRIINEVFEKYKEMLEVAKEAKMDLIIISSYRDYKSQETIYNNYVKESGEKLANRFSAKPGHSEHQLGLALDIMKPGTNFNNFENTNEAKWLKENAYKFGFILRYDKSKEYVTGYKYEPWHYRYVGLEVAKYIFENDITFDEYYAFYLDK